MVLKLKGVFAINPTIKELVRSKRYAAGIKTRKHGHEEDDLQECFADWLTSMKILFTASCAGMRTSMKVAIKMKKMGAKKGFPDILILEPVGQYHGLFIEVKIKGGSASCEQKEWRDALNAKRYHSVIMPTNLSFAEGMQWLKKTVMDYMNHRIRIAERKLK